MKIAYFSPTGNTKLLAIELQKQLGGTLLDISKVVRDEVILNSKLIIMFSIHAFSAPKKVLEFTRGVNLNNVKKAGIIAVGCTTSSINNGASHKLKKVLQNKNIDLILDEVIQMPLTIVTTMSKEKNVEIVKKAKKHITSLVPIIQREDRIIESTTFSSKMISSIGAIEKLAAPFFGLELHATKNCTNCGICWNNCPVQNIVQSKKRKPKFQFHCIMCLKCIYDCPEKAIKPYLSRFIPIKSGYDINLYSDNEKVKGE